MTTQTVPEILANRRRPLWMLLFFPLGMAGFVVRLAVLSWKAGSESANGFWDRTR